MVSEHVIPKDMASPINFNQFLEKEKLKSNGSNFTDWFRHVRIFLNGGNLQYVLDAPLGDPPAETETDEVKNVYATRKTRYSQVQCAILCSLESDLQKRFEHHDPHELMKELKTIFETHAAVECYEASKHFFSCMMEEGSSISEHMLVMTGHAKKLSDLGIVIPNRLGINRVLQSLTPSYKNFVMNYNMQNMNKEFPELFGMLKAAEIEIKKEHQVLMVNKTTSFKKQGKSKGKFKKGGKKAATPPMKPKNGPKPDADCYYCKEKGHWKRNCSKYLADLKSGLVKKKKEEMRNTFTIDTAGNTTTKRSEGKIFVAKNGTFLEKEFLTKEVTGRKVELDEIEESLLVDQSSAVPENVPVPPTPTTEEANDNDHETSNETATEPRRSTRDRATPDWYDPCLNVMIVDNNDEDPATYEEAMMSPDSNKWQEAMKSEMGSMYDNKVWTLVDLPDSRKAVENKWIFKRKTDADGNITVYKARLVAKGFRQIQGVDYDETFSPVAKLKSVRILLAIAAFFDYEIWQMDVKTAFLNGDIEEELYMPVIKDLLRIGAQFVGYREYANKAEEKLAEANDRANTLAQQLEQSEKARKKAESDAIDARAEADKAKADAAGVEDLRKRLHTAENSLSDHIAAPSAREEAIRKRLTTQSRRFVARTAQEFQLDEPANDSLLDALSLLEVHGSEARGGIDQAKAGSWFFQYFAFSPKENSADASSAEDSLPQELDELRHQLQFVKKQSLVLMEKARKSSEAEEIALQQAQTAIAEKDSAVAEADAAASRENSMLQLLTDASLDMADAETLPALMDKFRDAPRIHGFVRAQLAAGARFAMIMIKICYPKLDVGQIVPKCLEKMSKRKRNFGKYDDIVTPVAEDMMDELLRMDSEFFVKGSYAEHSTRAVNNERLTIDNILGNP
ncbi:hypothetical protein QYE76_033724 [Lolium multiflorum]|uniref:CCHC-type domain-containing protein n=1 Tax=Lolium multiflorum TaxID=4521 RepID=A0AAD8QW91_LOLMU|nr:hypothetical protein QYE76_033724 [Lolium multiflorum]